MSQTRVCEPPSQGDSSTDSSTWTAPELTRSWSDRERSVAVQAKAWAEGRFPGQQLSPTELQREYIRVERSKGVSQWELAKRLEVSRWTIQQVDR